jgi:peptide deformylase
MERLAVQLIYHPHPTLRRKSKTLRRVGAEFKNIVHEMFALMYEHKGVGLAANQVDLPYRFFIVNLESDPAKGKEFVFINPVISKRHGTAEAEEGCLSFPEIYAPVKRSEKVTISAYNLAGEEVNYELDGMFARAVQHEYDHLDGIVFIDRLSPVALMSIKDALLDLESQFQGQRHRGAMPDDNQIASRLAELEALRT